ncbi:MAG TPA: patatin-like phospholipase family protein [Bacillota bacterium]
MIRRVNYLLFFLSVTLFLTGVTVLPQVTATPSRPRLKVGIALGGGSALGFTHIGVLQWLEEHRIPVDYVAGTSMGGLIGGLYAMGMSPAEIMALVKQVDWNRIFSSGPPYNTLNFRRKEDARKYPSEIQLGHKDGIFIQPGLSVYQVYLLLSRLALPYSDVDSFDELPIPYRCVAADICNSETVVLSNGSLAEALRATMSVPGVFVPVKRDGRVLVDGGIFNNVPADVAKAMGAATVIAVDCNESNSGKDLRRLDSVLMSTINSVIISNTRQALQAADIIIKPQPEGLSMLNWEAAEQFSAAGYRAAAARAEQLQQLALDEPAWQEYQKQRAARKRSGVIIPQTIEVRGTNQVNRKSILTALQPLAGKPLDPAELDRRLTEVMGSGFYESIRYELQADAGYPSLLVTVTEKSYGPPFFRFAVEAVGGEGWTDFKLWTRAIAFDVWGANSELRVDLGLGNYPVLAAELYQPFQDQGWFIAPQFKIGENRSSFFQEDNRWSDFEVKQHAIGLDLGYFLSRFTEIRLGYQLWNQKPDTLVGPAAPDLSRADGSGTTVGLKISYHKAEGQSSLQPGVDWELTADWYPEAPGAETAFGKAESKLRWIRQAGTRSLLLVKGSAGVSFDGPVPFLQQYTLGGPFRLGAYELDELRGENYWLGTLGILTPLGGGSLRNRLFAGVFLENGATFNRWSAAETETNLSVGLVSPWGLGTAWLGISCGESNRRIHLMLGQPF